jgi:hypothetical protein
MDGHVLYYQTSIMTYFWQRQSVTRVTFCGGSSLIESSYATRIIQQGLIVVQETPKTLLNNLFVELVFDCAIYELNDCFGNTHRLQS